MSASEAASASAGPRYAPDDPSLPQPWKGLIDGSTGLLYYWNPETNITQYEKPTVLPPPLPVGPPPVVSTPMLSTIPGAQTTQPNGGLGQPGQQMMRLPQQGQDITPVPQQHAQNMPNLTPQQVSQVEPNGQQQGSQVGSAVQQDTHVRQQVVPQGNLQNFPPSEQQLLPNHGQQMPQHLGQQSQMYQYAQVGPPQGYQYPHQQMPYMPYQQNVPPQGPQRLQQHSQEIPMGQQFPHQPERTPELLQREDIDFQQGKPVSFSPMQPRQPAVPSVQTMPPGTNSARTPDMGFQPGQGAQFNGNVNMQQHTFLPQPHQSGPDLVHQQHGPGFQNQMGPNMMHGQQPNVHPVGARMGYDENPAGRAANEYHSNANKDGPRTFQQPKLAAIPMARNQQEMRMGGVPPQNLTPAFAGGQNAAAGPALHGMHLHASSGPSFPDNARIGPPPTVMGSADSMSLSPVDMYRQKHEVTAMGDNIPAPFMTFEATGFPPEILREVRYLLLRSICRTLHCYAHTYATTILRFGDAK